MLPEKEITQRMQCLFMIINTFLCIDLFTTSGNVTSWDDLFFGVAFLKVSRSSGT